ncbi:MAG TPA: efflux RND transporter periplasmic adaptor subunit [Terriglobales bacterium]|nr:efflux RND transporter periplasmic adaptor subunit [Terriglobales bacterium]
MDVQRPSFTELSRDFFSNLLREREVKPTCALLAQQATDLLRGGAVVIYILDNQDQPQWVAKATVGDVHLDDALVPLESGTLGVLADQKRILLFSGGELVREDYAHLHARRTLQSLAYVPIMAEGDLIGALEAATFDGSIDQDVLKQLDDIAEYAGPALASALAYERERSTHLTSISRLTQLYDLEKVFNSNLELDDLIAMIASKFQEVMSVQAVNVWMVDGDAVVLTSRAGFDPTGELNLVQRPGEGISGDISDSGESVLINDPDDQRLAGRNGEIEEGRIWSLLASPLMDRESLVGVVELINRQDGLPFDEDDEFMLASMCETANNALHNASLLLAERKLEILEALVKTSAEITATLDLDRVLQSIVNGPAAVIPYERAVIALEQRGRSQLKAVSGTAQVNADDPQYRALKQLLEWASLIHEPILVTQHGSEINADREETRAKFEAYFAESGMRAFHLVPLLDEEGRVGTLCFESSDPDFLTEAHLEMIKVLGSQATVALRNASLYKEVPFIGVLEPLLQKKQKFLALEKRRRAAFVAGAAALLIFLVAFPLPLRVDGIAVVAPARAAHVGAQVEGVIRQVNVREGDIVRQGAVLASLEDSEFRSQLAAARAKYETAISQMDRALANNDGTEAGIQRAQADYWQSEVGRAEQRLNETVLRSAVDGVVATPQVENMVGRKLKFGDTFADIVDNSHALIDVTVDENDIALVRPSQQASIKLDGFPTHTFHGEVVVVSPQAQLQGDQRVFYARISVPNPDGELLAGMQGRGKVSTGWRPTGVVLFRRMAMWAWSKLWDWFGW